MATARRVLGLLLLLALLGAGWTFAERHSVPVAVNLGLIEWRDIALWLALLGAFAAGALLVGVLALYKIARLALSARRYRGALRKLEDEVHQLRNLPLAGEAIGRPAASEGGAGSAP